ncbi:MAG: hypothetical protein WDO24_11540 [Pseudomonadota bacterium]
MTTRDRVDTTLDSITSILFDGGFDLLWLDGSATDAGRALPHQLAPNLASLREIHDGVVGGPDVAIFSALTRMLALDYGFCGLIETDIRLARGWFDALMGLFEAGAADGLVVGAATVRAFEQRILMKRRGYAVSMNSGAGMILFTRAAARLIVDHYRTPSTPELRSWFLFSAGLDCETFGESAFRLAPGADVALASDYQYDMVLQRHGLCSLAASPGFAVDLDAGGVRAAELGGYVTPAPPDPDGSAARAVEGLRDRLAACRAADGARAAPYLHSAAMGGWIAFLHQLLFMSGSPARLLGRWRISWSKHHGPFLFESDDPAAALEFPLVGALCGLGYRGAADNAVIELHDGARPAVQLDARSAEPRPLYARASLTAAGAAPVRLRAAGPGWLRLFAIAFVEPQPWLPPRPRLEAERLVQCFEMQAAQGFIILDA